MTDASQIVRKPRFRKAVQLEFLASLTIGLKLNINQERFRLRPYWCVQSKREPARLVFLRAIRVRLRSVLPLSSTLKFAGPDSAGLLCDLQQPEVSNSP